MIPMLVLICGMATIPPGVNLQIGDRDPVRLRIEVVTDGEPLDRKWQVFLDRLFEHFDVDGNGTLSYEEAQRVILLPRPDGTEIKCDFHQLDSNEDGRATKEEFRAYYHAAGFAPVVAVIRQPDDITLGLSDALFRHLDRDGNGTISTQEWNQASSLLRRLDENENETLEPSEIIGEMSREADKATRPHLRFPIDSEMSTARIRLDLGSTSRIQLVSQSPEIRLRKLEQVLELPKARLRFLFTEKTTDSSFRTVREFYQAQFVEAMGQKPFLTKDELESDVSLQALAAMFKAADRDDNGNVTARELSGFLDLVEQGVDCQICIMIDDHGPSLFDLLDANADGILDFSELHQMKDHSDLSRDDIALSFRIIVQSGSPANQFGPVPMPKPKNTFRRPPMNPAASGPAWFRAMDRNSDGYVSAAEFRGTPELFATFDRNGDGRISPGEAEQRGK